ncbi:MAG: gliding motility-associated C-terminal domain-containing protein [Fluviicola sp.]|nr:gliding motility-associated C-terminal domain-containing protein [Fluviicola sp.]
MQVFYRFFLLMMLMLISFNSKSQVTYYQDIFNGGASFAGFSTGTAYTGSYNGNFETYFHPGSLIRKVFFLYNTYNEPNYDITINLDGVDIILERNELIGNTLKSTQFSSNQNFRILTKDITQIYNNIQNHQINIPSQPFSSCNCFYGNFAIVVLYDNPLLSTINFSLLLNNLNLNSSPSNYYTDINPISTLSQVGFSLNTDIINNPISNDGSRVYVNNNLLGLIGGSDGVDQNSIFGVRGHFYYQNSQLFGLDDDTPDSFMNNNDAIADISPYINVGQQLFWSLEWQAPSVHQNIYSSFQLAYSTPCQPQNVTVSNDTLICPNVPLQLNVSGGTPNSHSMSGYEWLPQENLSCYDCADPIFTGDSSQLYTVRIWGSDSCSVVRPVMVRVGQKPPTQSITNAPSLCGANSGSVNLTLQEPSAGIQFSIDNGPLQNNGYFNNLTSGNHTLSIHTLEGCSFDTLVTVGSYSTVNAAFTASPTAGAIPLQVNLSNQSSNYTNLEWFVDGNPQGNTLNNYTVNQSGTVEIELVAWQNDPTCSDTAMVSILAFDSLIISIPNVITPNNDGLNDVFSITSNLPINVSYSFTNRWGTVVASGSISNQQGTLVLWNPSATYSEGNYFYQLQFSSADVAIDQQIEQIGREKQGFLTLVK